MTDVIKHITMKDECPFNDDGNPCSCKATIENQAKVIRSNWSELQTLKRILIDEHPDTWREIKNKIQ